MTPIMWTLWVLSITTTTASTPDPNHDYILFKRLDSLERAIFQQQEDFKQERQQQQEDQQSLMDKLHALQKHLRHLQAENQELKKEMKALQDSERRLTDTSSEEEQGLRAEVASVQEGLDILKRKQQSLEDLVTSCEKTTKPDADVSGGCSGKEDLVTKKTGKNVGASTGKNEPTPAQKQDKDRTGEAQQIEEGNIESSVPTSTHQHQPSKLSLRSDDFGPLEVVVNQVTQQVTQMEADIQALKDAGHAQGSNFVRWGRSTCPDSSELVYSGVVGGSLYTHNGAAANTLCLSLSPKLDSPSPTTTYTQIYGGEYETHDSHNNRDPVCAVCRAHQPASVVIPGTDTCSVGWTKQYSGHLMGGLYIHHAASDFICVDSSLEAREGSEANVNGRLLYYTKTVCGSLPCPPYSSGKVMTCVVCSK